MKRKESLSKARKKRLTEDWSPKVGLYYRYRIKSDQKNETSRIIKILKAQRRDREDYFILTVKQIKPLNEKITEWVDTIGNLKKPWKYEEIPEEEVIKEVGEKIIIDL